MRVGINYPWGFNKYGLYFGPHWRDGEQPRECELDSWLDAFAHNVVRWRQELGVSVVRIFLLCNLQNLGAAPNGSWKLPARLDARFLDHHCRMLESAKAAGMQLIPSLVDFGIGNPWTSERAEARHAIVTCNEVTRAFFALTLEPFLEASRPFAAQIHAWELINEPSWLFRLWWPHSWRPRWPCATVHQVRSFLQQGIDRIRAAGFASTVGHRFLRDLANLPTGSLPQFHFYARRLADPCVLPSAPHNASTIVGEFSVLDGPQGRAWPWLPARADPALRVRDRLEELQRLGYPMALLWPDEPPFTIVPAHDPKLGEAAARGLRMFSQGRAPHDG